MSFDEMTYMAKNSNPAAQFVNASLNHVFRDVLYISDFVLVSTQEWTCLYTRNDLTFVDAFL